MGVLYNKRFILRFSWTVGWKTNPSIPADSRRKNVSIFGIYASKKVGWGGRRHDRPTSPLVKSMKNTFILFFSKTKEWKTFLMTWGLSISSEKEIKTLFEYVVQIGERGMRTGLDTLTKLQCEKVLFWQWTWTLMIKIASKMSSPSKITIGKCLSNFNRTPPSYFSCTIGLRRYRYSWPVVGLTLKLFSKLLDGLPKKNTSLKMRTT